MKSKFKIAGLTIIIIAVVFGLIAPNVSCAGVIDAFAGTIFRVLGWIITKISSLILTLSAAIFGAMLKEGFRSYKSAAQGAWTATRDIANMFFILFMVIVAFGTILRNEKYGAKKLLPKIIITALLINFSAVFCYVVIDLTNVAANAFLNMAKNEIRALNQQSDPDIAAAIVDSLKLTGALMPMDCVKTFDQDFGNCQFLLTSEERAICTENATRNKNDCEKWNKQIQKTKDEEEDVGDIIVAAIMSSAIMLIAAITLFMAGLVMLLRTVFIWVLVALAPLAIACSLLPTLRPNWEKWLKKFLNWCLFAPVFTFFIWLVVKIGTSNQIGAISSSVGSRTNLATAGAITEFFTGSSTLIRYCIVLATLIIGLMAAKELGVVGGDMAYNALNKMGKGAAGWAKRTSMRPVKAMGTAVGAGALKGAGKLFGDTKLGRRMGAKAAQIKQSATQTVENKKYANLLNTMTDENIEKEIMSAVGARKLIAVQAAKKRGILREANRPVAEQAMKTMRGYGDEEGARSLEELRPDAVKDPTKQNPAIERAIKEGTHKRWSKKVLESPEGVKVMGELRKQLGNTEFVKVFKGWAKDIQDVAKVALKEGFTNNLDETTEEGKDNMGRRRAHATVTGKLDDAFANYDRPGNEILKNKLKEHIGGWGDKDFAILNMPDAEKSRKIVVEFMKPQQVYGAALELSGGVKEEMISYAQKSRPEIFAQMQKSLGWAAKKVVDLREEKKIITEPTEEEFRKAREKQPPRGEKPFG